MFGKEVPKHEIEGILKNFGAKIFKNLTDLVRISFGPKQTSINTLFLGCKHWMGSSHCGRQYFTWP